MISYFIISTWPPCKRKFVLVQVKPKLNSPDSINIHYEYQVNQSLSGFGDETDKCNVLSFLQFHFGSDVAGHLWCREMPASFPQIYCTLFKKYPVYLCVCVRARPRTCVYAYLSVCIYVFATFWGIGSFLLLNDMKYWCYSTVE